MGLGSKRARSGSETLAKDFSRGCCEGEAEAKNWK